VVEEEEKQKERTLEKGEECHAEDKYIFIKITN